MKFRKHYKNDVLEKLSSYHKIATLNLKNETISVRKVKETDAEDMASLWENAYGKNFPYPEFFEPEFVKEVINSEEFDWICAQTERDELIASAALVPKTEAIGECGRWVIQEKFRNHGICKSLARITTDIGRQRGYAGLIVQSRTAHTYSQLVAQDLEFMPVGYVPYQYFAGGFEHSEKSDYEGSVYYYKPLNHSQEKIPYQNPNTKESKKLVNFVNKKLGIRTKQSKKSNNTRYPTGSCEIDNTNKIYNIHGYFPPEELKNILGQQDHLIQIHIRSDQNQMQRKAHQAGCKLHAYIPTYYGDAGLLLFARPRRTKGRKPALTSEAVRVAELIGYNDYQIKVK